MIAIKPWYQGLLIYTPMVMSMNKEMREEFSYAEKCCIYEDFHFEDEGRSRTRVAKCKDPQTAELMVELHNAHAAMVNKMVFMGKLK